MINFSDIDSISPIFLSVLLIIYLIIAELGNPKVKKTLLPFIVILIVIFAIIAVIDVISKIG